MKIEGTFEDRTVWVDGELLEPGPSLRVWRHSPDGFAWGYPGSGPTQLALAILLHAGVSEERALRLRYDLKRDLIQDLPQADFRREFDLDGWLLRHPVDGLSESGFLP